LYTPCVLGAPYAVFLINLLLLIKKKKGSDELGRRGVEGGDKAIGYRMWHYKLTWRDWWVCLMAGVKKMLGFGGGDGGSGGSGVKLHLRDNV
jgi:hypothetical protein